MTHQGHPRSLILAPVESAYSTSYWSSIVTLVLSCHILETLELLYAERHFFPYPTPIPAKILGYSPWSRSVFWVESEHPMLTNHEIIVEEFQRMYVITIPQCYEQTDRQTDDLP